MQPDPTAEEFLRELGDRVRSARLAMGFTQERLGQLVGLGRTSITNIEAGNQGGLGVGSLARIAAALRVHPGELFAGSSWRVMASLNQAAIVAYEQEARRKWDDNDLPGASRARFIAEGLRIAQGNQLKALRNRR